jgi:hypothetical protein
MFRREQVHVDAIEDGLETRGRFMDHDKSYPTLLVFRLQHPPPIELEAQARQRAALSNPDSSTLDVVPSAARVLLHDFGARLCRTVDSFTCRPLDSRTRTSDAAKTDNGLRTDAKSRQGEPKKTQASSDSCDHLSPEIRLQADARRRSEQAIADGDGRKLLRGWDHHMASKDNCSRARH